ncbi:MAG: PIN domain-containing protein [Verrucomicrobiota bacterium]
MKRAVFDTNVIVSGFLSPHGPPGRIVDWLRAGTVCAVLDDRIVDEYREVLGRPVFGFPLSEVQIVLRSIQHHGLWITASTEITAGGLPDPDDAPFLECARMAGVPVVTGNVCHYPRTITGAVPVMTPAEYIRLNNVR